MYITLCFRQQIKLDCEQHDTICHIDYNELDWLCGSHATAVTVAAQYQQFLDLNFKQYLIVSSPGAKLV